MVEKNQRRIAYMALVTVQDI